MYDDTCLKVMGLHERSSLSPEDVSVIASLDSAHNAGRAASKAMNTKMISAKYRHQEPIGSIALAQQPFPRGCFCNRIPGQRAKRRWVLTWHMLSWRIAGALFPEVDLADHLRNQNGVTCY